MYIVKAEVKTEMVPACNEQKAPPSSNLVSPWYRLLATQKMIWVGCQSCQYSIFKLCIRSGLKNTFFSPISLNAVNTKDFEIPNI